MRRFAWLGWALSTACWSLPARAELGADVRALLRARAEFGRVLRLKPRLLERGERLPLPLPPELLDPKNPSCVTVTVLGVPEAHFVIRFSSLDPSEPSSAYPEASTAGAIDVTRCGGGKPFLAGILLEMRSPRGVLETLMSVAPAGVPKLEETLPGRDPGVELLLGDPGPRPTLPPLPQRVERLSARARREAARSFEREELAASEGGSGTHALSFAAGCHQLTLLAEAGLPDSEPKVDLDLELVNPESDERVAVDHGDDADGALSWCAGANERLELRFVGARPGSQLTLTRARWDLPAGLPKAWGNEPRAALARLAWTAHVSLSHEPVYESLGVQGSSSLPVEIEPDACYTALLVPLRGEVRALSLSAFVHSSGEDARGASDINGTVVSFCAHGASHATLEVDGDGSSLSWLLSLWETGRAVIGSATP